MELNPSLRCAVVIATHHRQAELARTLAELDRLDPPPDEILICADGGTDGTVDFVRNSHPNARLIIHPQARGSIPSRNELADACTSEIFLSLDDDSYPMETDFIARLRKVFESSPRLAVASFPQRSDEWPETLTTTTFGASHYAGSYANSGAAIRRSAFLELGKYPDFFFHAYEEPDFALRCISAGWQIRHETSLTIRHHFTAAGRNERRTHQRHARNEFWSVLLRCPAPQLCAVALFRAARQFGYAFRRGPGWALREPQWWWSAIGGIPACLAARQPIPWPRYLAWMRLVRAPIQSEAEWESLFGKGRK